VTADADKPTSGFAAPLRYQIFRRIWIASVLSNLGMMLQNVGAAWAMTQLTTSVDLVALVQAAAMLPVMLFALPAGAISDMYDRRIVSIVALSVALVGAVALAAIAYLGLLTPWVLLSVCFLIGTGIALYAPSWQASVIEQVPDKVMPAAVALNSISYNIARSFGPAIGGVIVAAAGYAATFVTNAVFYVPLIIVLMMWKREVRPPRLPPEQLGRAVVSGARYIVHTPPVRIVIIRALMTGMIGGAVPALMPIIARDVIGGGAGTYGLLLGCFGLGAVLGALAIARIRQHGDDERWVRIFTLIMGAAIVTIALSTAAFLTGPALIVCGAMWMLTIALFNIGMQFSAPRWVAGRVLACFQAAVAGGVAVGSWIWGTVAQMHGVGTALLVAGVAMLLFPLAGRWLPLPQVSRPNATSDELPEEPDVQLAITNRSGPIVIELEYEVDPAEARRFYTVMQGLQKVRQRNGGYDWTLSRDIADPRRWIERFHCPTWLDYLRQRSRQTDAEIELHQRAAAFHLGPDAPRITRKLERPFGSVRWREDSPDREVGGLPLPITPTSGA
jgi:MFS family permease